MTQMKKYNPNCLGMSVFCMRGKVIYKQKKIKKTRIIVKLISLYCSETKIKKTQVGPMDRYGARP